MADQHPRDYALMVLEQACATPHEETLANMVLSMLDTASLLDEHVKLSMEFSASAMLRKGGKSS